MSASGCSTLVSNGHGRSLLAVACHGDRDPHSAGGGYLLDMGDPLADAHRRIAEAEHALEQRMLEQADGVPDPEHMRRRAHSISENARVHDEAADRVERRSSQ